MGHHRLSTLTMIDPVDLQVALDVLYRAPVREFVARRNELSRHLKLAGDPASAKAVRALKRPSPAAWVVNRLALDRPEQLGALVRAARDVRHIVEGAGGDLARASATRSEQLRSLLGEARALLSSQGHPEGPGILRAVSTTLEALAAADPSASKERPGRLTTELSSLGFEALSHVAVATPQPKPRTQATSGEPDGAERARALLAEAERKVTSLAETLRRAEARFEQAERDAAQLEERLTEAQGQLAKASAERDRAAGELDEARELVAGAQRALSR